MPDYTAGKARILLEPYSRGFYNNARSAIRKDVGDKDITWKVKLTPDATGFYTDAAKQLATIRQLNYDVNLRPNITNRHLFRSDAKVQVDTALKGLYSSFYLRPEVDLTKANAEMIAWRRKQEANPLRIKVVTDRPGVTTGAGSVDYRRRAMERQVAGRAAERDAGLIRAPRVDTSRAERDIEDGVKRAKAKVEKDPIKAKAEVVLPDRDARDLEKRFRELRRDIENNFKLRIQPTVAGVQLRLPIGAALGTQLTPALANLLGQVTGAIQQLSGVALTLPGALAAAGASLGTFALGISGISDAWKAMSDESDRAAEQQTSDARKVADANRDVTRAQADLTTANKDARRALEDLHSEQRSQHLTMAEALLDRQRALNELRRVTPGTLEAAEANVRYLRSEERIQEIQTRRKRTTEDIAEADAKGVKGADNVVAATDRLTDALNRATEGSTGAINAADKTKLALEKLSPAAREVVTTLFDMKPAFLDLRNLTSQHMLQGLSDEIKALWQADLPLLQKGFAGIATGINKNLKTITTGLRAPGTQGFLEQIFGNTAEAQKRLSGVIDPLIRIVGQLGAAGSRALPGVVTGLAKVTDKFSLFIDQADREGKLDQWIDNGIEAFESLARTIGNVVSIVHSIGDAFGGGLLDTIEGITRKVSNFFKSAEGQQSLMNFITDVRRNFEKWKPILEDLPRLLKTAFDAAHAAIETVLPVLNVFTEALEHMPWLVEGIVTAFLAWQTIPRIVRPVETALMGISGWFGKVKDGAKTSAKDIDYSYVQLSGESGGPAKAQSKFAKFGKFIGNAGPWGLAIAGAIGVIDTLSESHNTAADRADKQEQAEGRLADTLERVTNAAGAATQAMLAREMGEFQPGVGITETNAEKAARALGISPTEVLQAITEGGKPLADMQDKLRAAVAPAVLGQFRDAVGLSGGKTMLDAFHAAGVSDDDIVNAFLGDPDALDKFDKAQATVDQQAAAVRAGRTGFKPGKVPDLGDIATGVQQGGGGPLNATVLGQFLFHRAVETQNVKQREREAQERATGQRALPTDEVAALWPGVTASFDGAVTALRGPNASIPAGMLEQLKAEGMYPRPSGVGFTTVELTEDAAKVWTKLVPAFFGGGPGPTKGLRGPTGGMLAEMHPKEWVLPRNIRERVGDPWLWKLTKGQVDPKTLPGYQFGGPVPLFPQLPPLTPPPLPPIPPPPPAPPATDTSGTPAPAPGPLPPIPKAPDTPAVPDTPAEPAAPAPDILHGAGTGPAPGPVPGTPEYADAITAGLPETTADTAALPEAGAETLSPFETFLKGLGLPVGDQGLKLNPDFGKPGTEGAIFGPPSFDPKVLAAKAAEFGASFLLGMGQALLGGVLGFFGISNIPGLDAFKQIAGFYGNKLFASSDDSSYISPETQAAVDAETGAYSNYQLVTTPEGVQVLVPTSGSGVGGTKPPSGADILPLLTGSGVLPAFKGTEGSIEASGLPGAPILPDANILDYINQVVTKGGFGKLSVGSTIRPESGSQHQVGRAADISGSYEEMEQFAKWWTSDPVRRSVTRMLIWGDDPQYNMYKGAPHEYDDKTLTEHSARGNNAHIHLALEGVPGNLLFSTDAQGNVIPPGATTSHAGGPEAVAPDAPAAPAAPGGDVVVSGPGINRMRVTAAEAAQHPEWTVVGPAPARGAPFKPMQRPLGLRAPAGGPRRSAASTPETYGRAEIASLFAPQGSGGTYDKNLAPVEVPQQIPGSDPLQQITGIAEGSRSGQEPLIAVPGPGQSFRLVPASRLPALRPQRGPDARMMKPRNKGELKALAKQLYLRAGMPPGEWGAFEQLIEHESGWRVDAKNPSSTAFGLGQFLDSTQKQYNIVGSTDPAAQLMAIFSYLRNRPDYKGSPARAWALWNSRSPHWYQEGGLIHGPGSPTSDSIVARVSRGEFVQQAAAVDKYGVPFMTALNEGRVKLRRMQRGGLLKQDQQWHFPLDDDAPEFPWFAWQLNNYGPQLEGINNRWGGLIRFQRGGPVKVAATVDDEARRRQAQQLQAKQLIANARRKEAATPPPAPPSRTGVQVPDALKKIPSPAPAPPPPAAPPAGVGGAPVPVTAPEKVGAAPEDSEYLHPAISKGITEGARVAANLASTAISALGAGVPGAGAAGPLVAGLIQQGGKIAEGVANVGAAFLSGFTDLGGGGTTQNPYGIQLRSQAQPPPLAVDNRRIQYGDNNYASMDEWRRQTQLQDAQDMQTQMARLG